MNSNKGLAVLWGVIAGLNFSIGLSHILANGRPVLGLVFLGCSVLNVVTAVVYSRMTS